MLGDQQAGFVRTPWTPSAYGRRACRERKRERERELVLSLSNITIEVKFKGSITPREHIPLDNTPLKTCWRSSLELTIADILDKERGQSYCSRFVNAKWPRYGRKFSCALLAQFYPVHPFTETSSYATDPTTIVWCQVSAHIVILSQVAK